MGNKVYNKLVRDRIPEIIQAAGETPVTHILGQEDYLRALITKLREEITEFEARPSVEELADVKEVVIALREAMGIHAGELEDVRRAKAKSNGRFKKRIFLESVDK